MHISPQQLQPLTTRQRRCSGRNKECYASSVSALGSARSIVDLKLEANNNAVDMKVVILQVDPLGSGITITRTSIITPTAHPTATRSTLTLTRTVVLPPSPTSGNGDGGDDGGSDGGGGNGPEPTLTSVPSSLPLPSITGSPPVPTVIGGDGNGSSTLPSSQQTPESVNAGLSSQTRTIVIASLAGFLLLLALGAFCLIANRNKAARKSKAGMVGVNVRRSSGDSGNGLVNYNNGDKSPSVLGSPIVPIQTSNIVDLRNGGSPTMVNAGPARSPNLATGNMGLSMATPPIAAGAGTAAAYTNNNRPESSYDEPSVDYFKNTLPSMYSTLPAALVAGNAMSASPKNNTSPPPPSAMDNESEVSLTSPPPSARKLNPNTNTITNLFSIYNKNDTSMTAQESATSPAVEAVTYPISHGWIPQRSDELFLDPPDNVDIYQVFEDGWCEGRSGKSGLVGMFPLACLAPVQSEGESDDEGNGREGKRRMSERDSKVRNSVKSFFARYSGLSASSARDSQRRSSLIR
ncbi:hypothetical protein BC832DRAFT_132076 [Gaertneriomyces semiglobifer]|nr:hypothetical protein BC832DRAFT_132076 [Gaertneriomyces semiglobifer]